MSAVLRILGRETPDGTEVIPETGHYLRSFDADQYNGRGGMTVTLDIRRAMPFPDAAAAAEFWRKQSRTRPLRADGQPNRPLTAFTVEIAEAPS